MTNKVLFLLIFLSAITLCSCDDGLDFLSTINQPPALALILDGADTVSSVSTPFKTSLKSGSAYYSFTFYAGDPEGALQSLTYSLVEGDADLFVNGQSPTHGAIPLSEGNYAVEVLPAAGSEKVTVVFTVSDAFEATAHADVSLALFGNEPPVATFEVTYRGLHSPYEYLLDARASTDRDHAYGGAVTRYAWTLEGTTFITDQAVVPWVFGASGTYEVTLRVQDNDGAWSTSVSQTLNL